MVSLTLSDCALTHFEVEIILENADLTHLKNLDLSCNDKIGDPTYEYLVRNENLISLENLDLYCCELTFKKKIDHIIKLNSLNISLNRVDKRQKTGLCTLPIADFAGPHISRLVICGIPSFSIFERLFEKNLENLTFLDISSHGLKGS